MEQVGLYPVHGMHKLEYCANQNWVSYSNHNIFLCLLCSLVLVPSLLPFSAAHSHVVLSQNLGNVGGGASPLQGQAERPGAVQPGEEKALGRRDNSLSISKGVL